MLTSIQIKKCMNRDGIPHKTSCESGSRFRIQLVWTSAAFFGRSVGECAPKWHLPTAVIYPVDGLGVGEVCKNSGRQLGDDMVALAFHNAAFFVSRASRPLQRAMVSPSSTNGKLSHLWSFS